MIGCKLNGDPRPLHYFDDNPYKAPHAPGSAHGRLLPPIAGFPDIACRAFGHTGCLVLSILLYFELFLCVCIFFVAIGDHLHSLFPQLSQATHMVLAAAISLVPTIFLHTPRLLSHNCLLSCHDVIDFLCMQNVSCSMPQMGICSYRMPTWAHLTSHFLS